MIDVSTTLDALRTYGVAVEIEHTGGGNFVAIIGTTHGYDEEQGTTRGDVNVGPIYRETDGRFTANRSDLYAVSIHETRADETIHTGAALLPTILSMLGIEDVNVSDACVDLAEIANALGDGWSVGCLGGNNYGVTRADGTMVTIESGQSVGFSPVSITIGRQADEDEEWSELWHGDIYEAGDIVDIVEDRC